MDKEKEGLKRKNESPPKPDPDIRGHRTLGDISRKGVKKL